MRVSDKYFCIIWMCQKKKKVKRRGLNLIVQYSLGEFSSGEWRNNSELEGCFMVSS